MKTQTASVTSSRKMVAQVKKDLLKKIKKECRHKTEFDSDPVYVKYIDGDQHIQIVWIKGNHIATDDAYGNEDQYTLEELDVEILLEICYVLKIK